MTAVDIGCIPIHLGHVTSFGLWFLEQVVLDCHQRVSKFPAYHEVSRDCPLMCFTLVENMAVLMRPFMHPDYHRGLP